MELYVNKIEKSKIDLYKDILRKEENIILLKNDYLEILQKLKNENQELKKQLKKNF